MLRAKRQAAVQRRPASRPRSTVGLPWRALGAVGGAYGGSPADRSAGGSGRYRVTVRMDDGGTHAVYAVRGAPRPAWATRCVS
ncbi:MAG: hypothetical protein MZW92_39065 [Comamonadaceae bacterium]|nr:hypothetical protein [Comamonadaceae bacterium]